MIEEIKNERLRQIAKGYNADSDDNKTSDNWCNDIIAYAQWARQMGRMGSPEKYRRRMKQIAAMAISACESFDRLKKDSK